MKLMRKLILICIGVMSCFRFTPKTKYRLIVRTLRKSMKKPYLYIGFAERRGACGHIL